MSDEVSTREINDNERNPMTTYTDCPDAEVITISSAISDAFGEASHLRHEVVDALDRSLAAEVQKHLAAARRALDAYVDQSVDVHEIAATLSDDGDIAGLVELRESVGVDIAGEHHPDTMKLGRLTPAQKSLAESVLNHCALPGSPPMNAQRYDTYVVARIKRTSPQPDHEPNVGVRVYEVGSKNTLDKLAVKGYLTRLTVDAGYTSEQTYYAATSAGLAWWERQRASVLR